ncbi:hypothetical protein [Gracilimonas mengyeensis]|uniref:Ca-activated chloride channel family protein n=1 Tax=Gracilimonas mengyeensis TaxID=1302730 RepID=A0A521DEK5_9BACT|nr:hypothetical protein [Gracilimonas mengyeensis]SMO69390.1 hypothetical protein SAMN06265219_10842 [Gracilimonas mengyeensis]
MKILSAFLFVLCMMGSALAQQQAEEYFHGGAQSFINNDLQNAISQVQEGLNQYPDNPKLNALMEQLQKEQERQQQQQNQNQNQNQQDQQQQDQEQQEQNQDQQQNQQDQEQQEKEQEQQQSEGQQQGEQQPEEVDAEALESQQISKEEAEKILKALAQKEKELLKEFKKKRTQGSAKHDKDW